MIDSLPAQGPTARFLARLPAAQRAALAARGVTADTPPPPPRPTAPRPPPRATARYTEARANKRQAHAERRHRLSEREAATERRLLERLQAKIEKAGGRPTAPAFIPPRVWRAVWAITTDDTGAAARLHLSALRNRPAADAITRAALGAEHLAEPRTWADLRTRRIAALGIMLAQLAAPTRRKRDRWHGLVKGIYTGAFTAALHNHMDPRPAPPGKCSNGRAKKRPGTPHFNTVFDAQGYLAELEAAGLCYRQQLHAAQCDASETAGPSGHATNRYWLIAGDPQTRITAAVAAQLAALIADDAATMRAWTDAYERTRRKPDKPPDKPPPSA